MKNNTPKTLPKDTKFATINSNDEEDILLEILIANLIHNGTSFDKLMGFTEGIKDKKDREQMRVKATNIILDFIKLNPHFSDNLQRNDNAHEFLKSLGLNL
jgi:hypothetical protein